MPPLSPVPEDDVSHRHSFPPLPLPPRIFRPEMMIYDGNGSKESIIASEYYSSQLQHAGGEFYGPRLRGLDTEASSLSEDFDEKRREFPSRLVGEKANGEGKALYRRPWVIALYVAALFVAIAMAAALGVIYS
jgi:hypothetical protein